MSELYYTPPEDHQFMELKQKAINLWLGYSDQFGYASEKIGKIKDIKNVGDNFMYMVAMFDEVNQKKLAEKLSEETRKAVRDRMIDGGADLQYIVF